MKRSEVISTGMFVILLVAGWWTSCAAADPPYVIGVLTPSAGVVEKMRALLFPELAKLGFTEGKNLTIEVSSGQTDQLPQLARQLALAKPAVVIAVGSEAIRAMRAAANTTPIVGAFIGEDPLAAGFAKSLARPGGMVTGIAMLATELDAKRLLLLHELVPQGQRIAALAVNSVRDAPNIAAMNDVAARVGVKVLPFFAGKPDEYRSAFAAMHDAAADAVEIISAPELFTDSALLAEIAKERKLPTICEWASMASQGCLVGYGPDFAELHRRVADYVARLLRGEKAAELPIEGPTHFEFAVNLKTAKAIDLTIPPSILIRASEVID
jgi:putative ABC transport system substrate-binding protein